MVVFFCGGRSVLGDSLRERGGNCPATDMLSSLGVLVFLSVNLQSGLWSGSMPALEYPHVDLPQNQALQTLREGQALLLLKGSIQRPQ